MLSWATLTLGLASAAVILVDSFIGGYRQPVRLMELVWPVTALYLGPAAIMAYRKWGRPQSPRWRQRYGNPPKKPRLAAVVFGLYHCLSHCALGAIIATLIIFNLGIDSAIEPLRPLYIGDYLGAVAVGVAFRYATEAHTGGRRVWAAIRAVVREDLLTVSTVELALFIWIALLEHFVFGETLRPSNPVFWFIHQIGLIIGFFAAWPVTSWLIHRGIRVEAPGTLP
ncbi:DUF4396 domain-containing protein [Micromonospora sp. NPDC048930]|uniref:DUF4396 domain-containing protein n=1 Tax=Micromonospora sp. NPDC048930 TaxID=3364261 RepID=UPI003710F586